MPTKIILQLCIVQTEQKIIASYKMILFKNIHFKEIKRFVTFIVNIQIV